MSLKISEGIKRTLERERGYTCGNFVTTYSKEGKSIIFSIYKYNTKIFSFDFKKKKIINDCHSTGINCTWVANMAIDYLKEFGKIDKKNNVRVTVSHFYGFFKGMYIPELKEHLIPNEDYTQEELYKSCGEITYPNFKEDYKKWIVYGGLKDEVKSSLWRLNIKTIFHMVKRDKQVELLIYSNSEIRDKAYSRLIIKTILGRVQSKLRCFKLTEDNNKLVLSLEYPEYTPVVKNRWKGYSYRENIGLVEEN